MEIEPIAYIKTPYKDKFGIPRQSGRIDDIESTIVFYPKYRIKEALKEIDGFEYLWLIFDFSENHRDGWSPTVRPPRLGGNKRVGVFASRSPFRPNNLGLSSVRLKEVRHTNDLGDVLVVCGADILDNTPIYDIKPYLPFSDSHENARFGYAENTVKYSVDVLFPDELKKGLSEDEINTIIKCLSEDPRPSYIDDKTREYGMTLFNKNINFIMKNNTIEVTKIEDGIQ